MQNSRRMHNAFTLIVVLSVLLSPSAWSQNVASEGSVSKHVQGIDVRQPSVFSPLTLKRRTLAFRKALLETNVLNPANASAAVNTLQRSILDSATSGLGISVKADNKTVDAPSNPVSTATASEAKQGAVGFNGFQTLINQLDLQFELVNLDFLLTSAANDLQDTKSGAGRGVILVGIPVTLTPSRKDSGRGAVVDVVASIQSDEKENSNPKPIVNENDGSGLRVSAILPRQRTFNVQKVVRRADAFNLGAGLNAIGLFASSSRASEDLVLVRDFDTVAYTDEFGEHPKGAVKFGWEFRPVLGNRTVEPGERLMLVSLSGPILKDLANAKLTLKLEVTTRWINYDGKTRALESHDKLNSGKQTVFLVELSKLKPIIKNVNLTSTGKTNEVRVQFDGDGLYPELPYIIDGNPIDIDSTGTNYLSFVTSLAKLASGGPEYVNLLGQRFPLRTESFMAPLSFTARPSTLNEDRSQITLSLTYDARVYNYSTTQSVTQVFKPEGDVEQAVKKSIQQLRLKLPQSFIVSIGNYQTTIPGPIRQSGDYALQFDISVPTSLLKDARGVSTNSSSLLKAYLIPIGLGFKENPVLDRVLNAQGTLTSNFIGHGQQILDADLFGVDYFEVTDVTRLEKGKTESKYMIRGSGFMPGSGYISTTERFLFRLAHIGSGEKVIREGQGSTWMNQSGSSMKLTFVAQSDTIAVITISNELLEQGRISTLSLASKFSDTERELLSRSFELRDPALEPAPKPDAKQPDPKVEDMTVDQNFQGALLLKGTLVDNIETVKLGDLALKLDTAGKQHLLQIPAEITAKAGIRSLVVTFKLDKEKSPEPPMVVIIRVNEAPKSGKSK